MAYEVTATRKRPRSFDGLVGQEFVVSTLKNAIANGRIAHAYLFAGPRGVGKTSAARIVARLLNCQNDDGSNGCGDSLDADDISRGRALDVIEIDGASNTSVNDVRVIRDEVLFPPQASKYKIYIIDEVHMLSTSAFNALLKTIEEPPPYVIFIFATTEIHKVPATIRSRCQQFNFRLISHELIIEKLQEAADDLGVKADTEALAWIAKEGTGSMRDSYTLFDQVVSFSDDHITLGKIREKLGFVEFEFLNSLAQKAFAGNARECVEILEEIIQSGISIEQVIIDLAEYYRSLLFVQIGITRESVLGSRADRYPTEAVHGYTRAQLEKAVALFLNLYREIRYSLDPKTELELAIVRLSRLKFSLDSQEIVEKMDEMERKFFHASHLEHSPAPQKIEAPVVEQKKNESKPAFQVVSWGEAENNELKLKLLEQNPLLAGTFEGLVSAEITQTVLKFEFSTQFAVQKCKQSYSTLVTIVRKVKPFISEIEFYSREKFDESAETEENDPQLAVIKEVFRAEVVKE